MTIKVQGAKLTTWLNETQMIELEDEKIGQGSGGIVSANPQRGDVKVSWRNIEIKEL